ncbi:hypothetical protein DYB32_001936 [Aphanomyces invadans]|uniref:t-SNARE coiled-coil homology domain-containing protein n=1 Tax=Aphanomyces invadans TaxID=157072 RepID=A0A3R6W1P6_9STRA|nr:hypothetical protein DYB32_001936 [Aphanomyces invadans]
MSRELDGLLDKLAKINVEMGGEETRDKKGVKKGDRFGELRVKISERLHALKIPVSTKKPMHPREKIQQQQAIRNDLQGLEEDLEELRSVYEAEAKKKKVRRILILAVSRVSCYQIGTGVLELGQLARGLNEELVKQNIMLEGLEERIDNTSNNVENLNAKMKKTLTEMGRSGDKCMMDFICLVILLGILAVVYNMFVKKTPT